jgi:hypothetical protein
VVTAAQARRDPGAVFGHRRLVRRVETEERRPGLDPQPHPALHPVLLDGGGQHLGSVSGGADGDAVLVGDDRVVGEDGDAAAGDGDVHIGQHELDEGGRRRAVAA